MEYYEHARDTLKKMKEINNIRDAWMAALQIKSGGYLLPVCEVFTGREDIISLLSKWRDENQFVYPTQFTVTDDGTARWLRNGVFDVAGRILFFVVTSNGLFIGHIGLNNAVNDMGGVEFDNIVRGIKTTEKGIMSRAMRTLESWARNTLKATYLYLKVFSDNKKAVDFYKRLGWEVIEEIPLKKHKKEGDITYKEEEGLTIKDADKIFLKMILK